MVDNGERPEAWGPFPAHAHRVEELEDEVRSVGFADVEVLAIEGFFHLLADLPQRLADSQSGEALLLLLERYQSDPGLLHISGHLMAIGHRPLL
jgi:hypothetical protein